MTGLARIAAAALALLAAHPAWGTGVDCATAHVRYSSRSLLADIMIEPRAVAVVKRVAPQALAPFGGAALPAGFGRILDIAATLKGDPRERTLEAQLDHDLAAIPLTRAATLARCASYDEQRPALPAVIRRPALLIFDKITGFRDTPSVDAASLALAAMAKRRGWTLVTSHNAAVFNARDLCRFDAVVWNNVSGDALTLRQRAAFRRWIERGGGYAGFHGSAGDPVSIWPWYVDTLIGARFIGHPGRPQFQPARVHIEQQDNPITAGLSDWTLTEEWYSFGTNPRGAGTTILATIDEATYSPIGYRGESVAMGKDHQIAWTRCVGRGRSFYSAIGHRPENYGEVNSLAVLERGIAWTMRGTGCGRSASR